MWMLKYWFVTQSEDPDQKKYIRPGHTTSMVLIIKYLFTSNNLTMVENRRYLAFIDGIEPTLERKKKLQLFQLKHYCAKEEASKLRAEGKGRKRMENTS